MVNLLDYILLLSSNEKTLAKCNELLKLETKNVSTFWHTVQDLWWYCESYNPELSKDDDDYCDDQQLKEACEKFLDKVKDL